MGYSLSMMADLKLLSFLEYFVFFGGFFLHRTTLNDL